MHERAVRCEVDERDRIPRPERDLQVRQKRCLEARILPSIF
jgi:hypothetical protein